MDVTLKMLKSFVDVTEEKNISKVAKRNYISQPALSLQLKKLEEIYGVKLLERTMKGVEPTEAGLILAEYGRHIWNIYNQSFEEITNLKKQCQTIRIEANLTLATYVLPVIVYQMQQEDFENCRFDLTFNTTAPVESNILNGLCQVGFVQNKKDNPNLIYTRVADDHLVVVAAADYDVPQNISMEQLRQYPMIEGFDKLQERLSLQDTLQRHGLLMEELNVVMTLDSTESVKTALSGRIGAAMLPYSSVRKELDSGNLKQIQVHGLRQIYPVYMVYLKEKQYDLVQEDVLKYLKTHIKGFFEVEK